MLLKLLLVAFAQHLQLFLYVKTNSIELANWQLSLLPRSEVTCYY